MLLTIFAGMLLTATAALARNKSVVVNVLDGLEIIVPLPSTVPSLQMPPNGADLHTLYAQESSSWIYRTYRQIDLNHDGRIDYYLAVELVFGPQSGDLDVSIEWHKAKLDLDEEAVLPLQKFNVLGGLAGTDYRPLFYTIALQSVTYHGSSSFPRLAEMGAGTTLVRRNPHENLTAVSISDFRDFLRTSCH